MRDAAGEEDAAISESREEEEGLLTKTETRKMTTMTKTFLPFREPTAFLSWCDQDSSNQEIQVQVAKLQLFVSQG